MSDDPDEQLRAFLRERVRSYEELEALLFLARNADRDWSPAEVARALGATAESLAEALQALAARSGLVRASRLSAPWSYRYVPSDDAVRQCVKDLAQAYAEHRLNVVQMLSTNALERVRGAAMRRLADAFRLERGKK